MPREIRIVLSAGQGDFHAVEVFVGKKSLCASTGHSVQEAYEKVIKKLAEYGQEAYRENQKFAEFIAASCNTTAEAVRKMVLR